MASGKTEHYLLSQWEATDQVLRADFNADNAKIDAALKSAEAKADNAQALAQSAYTKENAPFVVGSYTGNGAASRTISLGFTPSAVLVFNNKGETAYHGTDSTTYYGGLAVEGQVVTCSAGTVVGIVEGGFQVSYVRSTYVVSSTNNKDYLYCYLALK